MTIKELYNIFLQNPNICTDTRKIDKGSIFFALKGDNFNGNKFAAQAIDDGCKFAIIDEKGYQTENIILVNDVLETLQELATYHRNQLRIPVVGITGTNGKTTSKELLNAVLSSGMKCYSTKGNLNNHIGVPLSILEIKNTHKIAIIEMGANHKGEINFLCKITIPTHGVITNIGSAHIEGFKNLQGVIDTKKELYNFLKETNGHLFVNNDDDLLLRLSEEIERTTYGNNGDCKGVKTKNTPFISVEFNGLELSSNLIGDYQFNNIMLAICIGNYFKITNENIKTAIEDYTPTNNRSEIVETKNNTLILDAYNANPSSMKAMLNSFSKQNYDNKLCILGDMLELGEYSKLEHKSIINLCEKLELECIYVGEEFNEVSFNAFSSRVELEEYLQKNSIKNKTILLKGSRGIGLEKLEKYL